MGAGVGSLVGGGGGCSLGAGFGSCVGRLVGWSDGAGVGSFVGALVGVSCGVVGCCVGCMVDGCVVGIATLVTVGTGFVVAVEVVVGAVVGDDSRVADAVGTVCVGWGVAAMGEGVLGRADASGSAGNPPVAVGSAVGYGSAGGPAGGRSSSIGVCEDGSPAGVVLSCQPSAMARGLAAWPTASSTASTAGAPAPAPTVAMATVAAGAETPVAAWTVMTAPLMNFPTAVATGPAACALPLPAEAAPKLVAPTPPSDSMPGRGMRAPLLMSAVCTAVV